MVKSRAAIGAFPARPQGERLDEQSEHSEQEDGQARADERERRLEEGAPRSVGASQKWEGRRQREQRDRDKKYSC
jgi:hypothetical protein